MSGRPTLAMVQPLVGAAFTLAGESMTLVAAAALRATAPGGVEGFALDFHGAPGRPMRAQGICPIDPPLAGLDAIFIACVGPGPDRRWIYQAVFA